MYNEVFNKNKVRDTYSSITEEIVTLSLLDINLDDADKWHDLITQKAVEDNISNIMLKPYQTVWLSNK